MSDGLGEGGLGLGWLGLLCVPVRVCFYGCAQRLQWRNNKEGKAAAETIN